MIRTGERRVCGLEAERLLLLEPKYGFGAMYGVPAADL